MTTPAEENTRLIEELQAELADLNEQAEDVQTQLASADTPSLRGLRDRTYVEIERITQEISRLQNTPASTNSAEHNARVEERASARNTAEEIINEQPNDATEERLGTGPTFFREEEVQTFYHDIIVYIQGVDVTRYIQGSVTIMQGVNEATNTFSCVLNNTGDLFTITPENIDGNWRLGPDEPFSEDAKKAVFDIKNDQARNPFDIGEDEHPGSDARRWNLAVYGCVFHRMDPVRVWVHNPLADAEKDEWLPVFTGYLTTKGVQDGWVSGESTIQLQGVDIREWMRHMRLDRNSLLYETPGGRSVMSEAGTPRGAPRAQRTGNEVQLPIFTTDTMLRGYRRSTGDGRVSANAIADTLVRCNELLQRRANTLGVAASLSFFADLIRNGTHNHNSWTHLSYLRISHAITLGSENAPTFVNVRGRDNLPQAHTRASAAVGRMREGLAYYYPDPDSNTRREGHTPRPGEAEPNDVDDALRNSRVLNRWYKLCLFGSPVRNGCDVPTRERLAPKLDDASLRYWTLSEVRAAGERTVTDDIWAPDMQLVHWLVPNQGTNARSSSIVDVGIGPDQVAGERSWTTRFDLLLELTNLIDYRFWVTGVGDIVFEFPLYDFYPQDFGLEWENVMRYDQHLIDTNIDEEHSDVPTAFTAIGSITGITNVPNPETIRTFSPGSIPTGTVWSSILASRFGIKIVVETFSWITSRDKLRAIAMVRFQKHLMDADSFSATTAFRVFMSPNRPFHVIPRERIALTHSVTHTWEIFGEAQTSYDLHGSRYLDIYGVRRNITGGRSLALSFAAIPGAMPYNSVPSQTALTARVRSLLSQRFTPDEIVYGNLENPRSRTPTLVLDSGARDGSMVVRQLTPEQKQMILAVRASIDHIDALANTRRDWRTRGRTSNTRSGADVLARAVDLNTIPAGRSFLNVANGFRARGILTDAQALEVEYQNIADNASNVNDITRAIRNDAVANPFNPEHGITYGASGIRSVEETEQRLENDRRTYRVTQADPMINGATREFRTAFKLRREGVKPNIFDCTNVSQVVGFWRDMRRAAEHQLTQLSARSRDLLIGMCAIETATGRRMANNNVGNIHTVPLHWTGAWHQGGAAPFNSYDTLEEGLLDLLRFLRVRLPRAHTLLLAGEIRYIYYVYAGGYSGSVPGTPAAAANGESKVRDLTDILATLRRMDQAGTITGAPPCDPNEQAQQAQVRMDRANRNALLLARAARRAATSRQRRTP